jgi:hypothetical protein
VSTVICPPIVTEETPIKWLWKPLVCHTGWANRGRDTLWEYLSDSFVLSKQAGKALSKWTHRIGDVICGGQPPIFDDIGGYHEREDRGDPYYEDGPWMDPALTWEGVPKDTLADGNRDKLRQFTDVLFEDDTDNRWHPKVRELLVLTLLLRYDQFCVVLRRQPNAYVPLPEAFKHCNPSDPLVNRSRDYTTIRNHLFVCRVERALEKAGVDKCIFNDWCKCARSAFIERNLIAIPDLSLYGGSNKRIMMDPRCFIDHLNSISALAQSNQHAVQQLRRQLNDMQEIMTHGLNLNQQLLMNQSSLSTSVRRMETHLLGNRPETVSPSPSSNVTPFTVSRNGISNNMSVSDVFVSFFYEDYRAGFELDKKSEAWKEDMDAPERKQFKNCLQRSSVRSE